jgi:hypothetical protein
MAVVMCSRLIDLRNAGVFQLAQNLHFVFEPAPDGLGRHGYANDLQGNISPRVVLLRFEYRSHSAFADPTQDAEVRYSLRKAAICGSGQRTGEEARMHAGIGRQQLLHCRAHGRIVAAALGEESGTILEIKFKRFEKDLFD